MEHVCKPLYSVYLISQAHIKTITSHIINSQSFETPALHIKWHGKLRTQKTSSSHIDLQTHAGSAFHNHVTLNFLTQGRHKPND